MNENETYQICLNNQTVGFHCLFQRRTYINQISLSYIHFVFSQIISLFEIALVYSSRVLKSAVWRHYTHPTVFSNDWKEHAALQESSQKKPPYRRAVENSPLHIPEIRLINWGRWGPHSQLCTRNCVPLRTLESWVTPRAQTMQIIR